MDRRCVRQEMDRSEEIIYSLVLQDQKDEIRRWTYQENYRKNAFKSTNTLLICWPSYLIFLLVEYQPLDCFFTPIHFLSNTPSVHFLSFPLLSTYLSSVWNVFLFILRFSISLSLALYILVILYRCWWFLP